MRNRWELEDMNAEAGVVRNDRDEWRKEAAFDRSQYVSINGVWYLADDVPDRKDCE